MQEYDLVYELQSELRYPRWVVWGVVQGENDLEMISMNFSSKLKNTAVWCQLKKNNHPQRNGVPQLNG